MEDNPNIGAYTQEVDPDEQMLPGDSPVEPQLGTYQRQFEGIRQGVCAQLQSAGADYASAVLNLVQTCMSANMQIASLADMHCQNIMQRFANMDAKLISHTNNNAMLEINGQNMLLDFDLGKAKHSILGARNMAPHVYDSQLAVMNDIILLRQIQALLAEPIDEANISIPYNQCLNTVSTARKELTRAREVLRAMIAGRAFTAFNFDIGLDLYTVNFSNDMSMIFYDRYHIVNSTMKSYYVEQWCIVKHTITGDVEPERFIELHKPSKNSMAMFYADRLCCLTDMVRPEPTMQIDADQIPERPVIDDNDLEDEPFTDEDLIELGYTEEQIAEYRKEHPLDPEQ